MKNVSFLRIGDFTKYSALPLDTIQTTTNHKTLHFFHITFHEINRYILILHYLKTSLPSAGSPGYRLNFGEERNKREKIN